MTTQNNWISVKDIPPPKDGSAVILCWGIDADGNYIDYLDEPTSAGVFVQVASWWEGEGWVVYCHMFKEPQLHFEPTHWQPLPEPPKELNHDNAK